MGVPISTSITMPFMTLANDGESLRQVPPVRATENFSPLSVRQPRCAGSGAPAGQGGKVLADVGDDRPFSSIGLDPERSDRLDDEKACHAEQRYER